MVKGKICYSIYFHEGREAIASWIARITHIMPDENMADLFTKSLTVAKRFTLFTAILYISNKTTELDANTPNITVS